METPNSEAQNYRCQTQRGPRAKSSRRTNGASNQLIDSGSASLDATSGSGSAASSPPDSDAQPVESASGGNLRENRKLQNINIHTLCKPHFSAYALHGGAEVFFACERPHRRRRNCAIATTIDRENRKPFKNCQFGPLDPSSSLPSHIATL